MYSRETQRERQRHRQREKQDPCREPDVGLDPGTPGSRSGPQAAPQPLSHPGAPQSDFFQSFSVSSFLTGQLRERRRLSIAQVRVENGGQGNGRTERERLAAKRPGSANRPEVYLLILLWPRRRILNPRFHLHVSAFSSVKWE